MCGSTVESRQTTTRWIWRQFLGLLHWSAWCNWCHCSEVPGTAGDIAWIFRQAQWGCGRAPVAELQRNSGGIDLVPLVQCQLLGWWVCSRFYLAAFCGSPGTAQPRPVLPIPSTATGTMPKLCSLQGCSPPACCHHRRCSDAMCWWCPHAGHPHSFVLVPGAGRASLGWSTREHLACRRVPAVPWSSVTSSPSALAVQMELWGPQH